MLISIQALRAFAAWLVVFHHFMQVFFNFHSHTRIGHLLSTRGQVGVDIFFIISGFVIYLSSANRKMHVRRFFLDRVIRIAPAYWLFTLLTAAIIYYDESVMPLYGLDLGALIKSLFFIPTPNPAGFGFYPILPVGWTLNFEIMFYLLFAISLITGRRHRAWVTTLLVIILACLIAQTPWVSSFYTKPVIYEFLLGIGLAMLYRRGYIPRITDTWAIIPCAIAAGCVATILQFDDRSPYRFLAWGVPGALLVASMICIEPLFAKLKPLKYLGDWSYSVYLLHIIVFWCAEDTLCRILGFTPLQTLLICIPVIALLSWLSFTYIEKGFSRILKKRLGLSRSTTRPSRICNQPQVDEEIRP